jgi:tetratricopeptide (TPR) repeat protein
MMFRNIIIFALTISLAAFASAQEGLDQATTDGNALESRIEVINNLITNRLYTEAMREVNGLIADHPDLAEAYVLRATIHGQQRRPAEARRDALKAIELDPESPRAYYIIGNSYSDERKWAEATGNYSKAIEFDPSYVAALNMRALAYLNLEDYDGAIADFTAAAEASGGDGYIYIENRGIVYGMIEKHKDAVKDFTMVIQFDPNRKKAYELRAISHRKLGNNDLAEADEQKARQLR